MREPVSIPLPVIALTVFAWLEWFAVGADKSVELEHAGSETGAPVSAFICG